MNMKPSRATDNRTKNMVQISLFAVIMAICAWISIPTVIPFTLQTFAVFLAVGVLGGKKGTAAICVYLLLGIIGIPVFSGGRAGIGVIFGTAGGYMIGWIFSGLVMWGMEIFIGRKTWAMALSMLLGLIVCYIMGTLWFMMVYAKEMGRIGFWTAIGWCVAPFVIPDLLKIAAALAVSKRLVNAVR